eukprot:GILI01027703.1.p1 GENE.GILI01027703.1~~GILI01027703.1.p1  ORF type:complete len:358 (+),score=14.54 GILI01027703.1:41-1114(+)
MRTRHPDLIDWCRVNSATLKKVRKERYALEKGFVEYAKDIKEFIKDYREGKRKRNEAKTSGKGEEPTPVEIEANRSLFQQATSMELLLKMKWERVRWAPDADYEGFARRVTDNDSLFKKVPAFSFLKLDIVKDPSSFSVSKAREYGNVSAGDLASWACTERVTKPLKLFRSPVISKSPLSVDWLTGQATFLDSVTANEIQTFLLSTAPQVMALQVRLDDEQKKITSDLESLRLRSGIMRFQYNDGVSYWQDPRRLSDPTYVNPLHMRMFIDGMLRGATFYRYYLSGHEVRIVHPSMPYSIDTEKKIVQIPADFADSNWVSFHRKAASFERIANACRRAWYAWFALAVMLLGGDLDIY